MYSEQFGFGRIPSRVREFVLLIHEHSFRKGFAWFSLKYAARLMNRSLRTAERASAEAQKLGLVVARHFGHLGRYTRWELTEKLWIIRPTGGAPPPKMAGHNKEELNRSKAVSNIEESSQTPVVEKPPSEVKSDAAPAAAPSQKPRGLGLAPIPTKQILNDIRKEKRSGGVQHIASVIKGVFAKYGHTLPEKNSS